MFTICDTRPHGVQGLLAREIAKIRPSVGSNSTDFDHMASRYEHQPELVKQDAPDIFAGMFSLEDSTRMLSADMQRRRNRHENLKQVLSALAARREVIY